MADQRKNGDKMHEVFEMLKRGVKELFTTEEYAKYLKVMGNFHEYSIDNQLLIASQRPDATLVAGYQAWQKKFNRHVKKGEKGIKIIAPMPTQRTVTRDKKDDQTGETVMDADGVPQTEEVTITVPRFRVVTVFDVSQTEGEPLPERPGVQILAEKVDDYRGFMSAIRKISPVPIRFDDDIPGTANGYFDPQGKEIVIRDGMPESQTVKTCIHEVAHAWLHDPDRLRKRGVGRVDQVTREVEAESTAYIVCNHYGIDTSEYTFPYIAAWSSNVEMKELTDSMGLVCDTAMEIIEELSDQLEQERDDLRQEHAVNEDAMPNSFYRQTGQSDSQEKFLECKSAVEKTIADHFDGMHLDSDASDDVIAKFGVDTVQVVLAVTVCQKIYDGRFSPDTKSWASELVKRLNLNGMDHVVVDSHPAVLDGFIGQVRNRTDATVSKDAVSTSDIGDIVYAPVYDNGQWKVTEIDLTKVRWIGHTMEHKGKAYSHGWEMYRTEESAWKYINNDPTANEELIKFDDDHKPFLANSRENDQEKLPGDSILENLHRKEQEASKNKVPMWHSNRGELSL